MHLMDPLDQLPLGFIRLEPVGHHDFSNDQHLTVLADETLHLADQLATARIYVTRFQRAPKSAGQSATSGSDNVVESRRMWRKGVRRDTIMRSDLRVHPEHGRTLDLR